MNNKIDVLSAASREFARIQDVRNRLPLFKSRIASSEISFGDMQVSCTEVVHELRDAYESIALPKGEFGRVSINLSSDDEASLCESIDEVVDELADELVRVKPENGTWWSLKISAILNQVEQLANFQETQLRTALAGYEPGGRAGMHAVRRVKSSSLTNRAVA